ncbi:hypothetical protein NLU66_16010 [Brachybacterium sp. NBEC-018]|uniref:Uncharacterized protein n=1 Tax=Brachybacterium rhamnosum TaxID=173361 RepID=A0ABW4PUK7_9MICO|nr:MULTISPECIES: hypothetical protein [unclassified Brachybacterium]QCR54702.1 hypothetical protein C1N80_14695 [Brachybacterium sp. SGAir0954]UVY83696.1 hypothetical protein NLU66_16010 [Brachybacterium sp. NBEC-018]
MNGRGTGLAVRLLIGAATALVVVLVCSLFDLQLALPLPLALGLAAGAIAWWVHVGVDHADQLHSPPLDLDVDYALPHAQDQRVRRLEETIHGAGPRRRMTTGALVRELEGLAAARGVHLDLPRRSGPDGPEAVPVDRAALHRHLRQLAAADEERLP